MSTDDTPLDVLGIGFGPANLALAAALVDARERDPAAPARIRFLERRSDFAWHPGMLLPEARIQVSFLKDLATFRDPRSRFTFLSYLWSAGRLSEFSNLRTFYPSRREFADYLRWVAAELAEHALYEREVLAVAPRVEPDGTVELLDVSARDLRTGRRERWLTRNLVLAAGGVPALPPGVSARPGGRVVHTAGFLASLRERFRDPDARYRFLVVGDGQSAAEAFRHLLATYPRAEVRAALRRVAWRPMDESHFANESFFPERVDSFYALPEESRAELLRVLHDTNYAVVDADLIADVYRRLYEERVAGVRRAEILPYAELLALEEDESEVRATLRDGLSGGERELVTDAVVLGTGYAAPNPHPLLEGLRDRLEREPSGRYAVRRDYRVRAAEGFWPGVFLQGFCTPTHGIGDSLLSLMAVRAGEIAAALRSEPRRAEFDAHSRVAGTLARNGHAVLTPRRAEVPAPAKAVAAVPLGDGGPSCT